VLADQLSCNLVYKWWNTAASTQSGLAHKELVQQCISQLQVISFSSVSIMFRV